MMIAKYIINPYPARLVLFISLGIFSVLNEVLGRDYFNPALLEHISSGSENIDLSGFEMGGQAQGTYHVDIILNGQFLDTQDIAFNKTPTPSGEDALEPCLSGEMLQRYGVNIAQYPGVQGKGDCADLSAIPQASSEFQFSTQKLLLSIPQAALSARARGDVAPELWDEGITAAMLNYSLSGDNSNSQYANLRPGINIGPWRLRNYTTWRRSGQGDENWDSIYTYVQRNIVPLKAQLVLGDSASPADVFDSIPFRGGQLASDDDMLPDSLKGYAPVVRGIARTNAQIVIRQNGYQIYQSYVAPGAFDITDMFPTGGAGDLEVTVKEADGSEQHFTVPFASLPVLQREGRFKYALTGGRYRSSDSRVEQTDFGQGTAIYGLPGGFTLYGGVQTSRNYRAIASGVGKNLGTIGALSADVIQSWAQPADGSKTQGQSWRVRYSKNSIATGTNFSIAGYRYSTRGYYGMQDAFDTYGGSSGQITKRRNRMEANVNQSLGAGGGSLALSAVQEDYWHTGKPMQSWSVGYHNAWNGVSYSVAWTLSKNGSGDRYDKDQQLALNISIPLDRFMSNTWASYGMNASSGKGATHSAGLSGTALAGNALNWNIQQGYGTDDVGYTGSLSADYKGTYADVSGGYRYDRHSQRVNYALAGGVLAYADGVTFSQPLGETNVLIGAPGASGVGIKNQSGVRTDFRGYTVSANVSPYRKNDIGLDTASVADDVELALTNKTVVPTRGAVVRADYVANVGLRVLLTLTRPHGSTVPFGAMVTLKGAQEQQFIVGDEGQVYLSGMPPEGTLNVVWGRDGEQHCTANYSLTAAENYSGVSVTGSLCR
ncbi:fimbria/pilus outer membrane usher protein [Citrobacter koseri]|uniref:fimbria/pilus outer membrane usher protein n=1 Tax=Citrobacter koseri TaxID=545 RepID=UPI003CE972D1